jgi:4'-phosphopantetheinyl transferase
VANLEDVSAELRDAAAAWYLETSTLDVDTQARLIRLLSRDERERRDRLVHEDDRRSYTAAHALVRVALARQLDCPPARLEFRRDPNGRPMLAFPAGTSAAFSLSHTRGLAACAVATQGRIGIDAERIDRNIDLQEIARSRFAPAEAAALERCRAGERGARFCEMWTLKEAAMKAAGLGLALPLDAFSFDLTGRSVRPAIAAPFDTWQWAFLLMDVNSNYKLALAAAAKRPGWPPRLAPAQPFDLET